MAKKRKTLPEEMKELLESGDLAALKEQFMRCEPNAITYKKYGSNIFSMALELSRSAQRKSPNCTGRSDSYCGAH